MQGDLPGQTWKVRQGAFRAEIELEAAFWLAPRVLGEMPKSRVIQ